MLTKRDMEIIEFMRLFGNRTFWDVLSKTFFSSEHSARQRVKSLARQGTLKLSKTGALSPKTYLTFGRDTIEYFTRLEGREPNSAWFSHSTYKHAVCEQIAYYHISKIRECTRTTIYKNQNNLLSRKLNHVPDFYFETEGGAFINVEVETSKKAPSRYKEIIQKTQKDGVAGILYIMETQRQIEGLANSLPTWNGLFFTTIDELVQGVKNDGKIKSKKQVELATKSS